MNDPWDVKSVRLGHQYSSCMKINGVPLLPPVLSKECRKEMQYYKLLAKEVEKRISILQPYIESDCDSYEDKTDAQDITECDDQCEPPLEDKVETTIEYVVDKLSPRENKNEKLKSPTSDKYNTDHSKVLVDFNVQIAKGGVFNTIHRSPRQSPVPDEIPERDCDYYKKYKKQKEVLTDFETETKRTQKELVDSIMDFDLNIISDKGDYLLHDGPSSLSSKSFTGSLNDLHADVSKHSQGPKLIRQRSYTVLNPSPQLLAHLEVQSMNTGVELNSISMSESMSNLTCSAKKRKSWDLESAKVKWSSMAMELKKKNIAAKSVASSNDKSKQVKSNSLKQDRRLQNSSNIRTPKSEPIEKVRQNPVTNTNAAKIKGLVKENLQSTNTKLVKKSSNPVSPKNEDISKAVGLISESDDPAARVRELYEKLQKQQLMQMANLMEKQKREQQLLQQVFEEQNNILLKQLKTVCPEGSVKVKQAWGEKKDDEEMDRGPVSLSQLINTSTELTDHSIPNSPVSKTLTESNSCLNKCDNMLKKSRDITSSIRRQTTNLRNASGARGQKSSDQVPAKRSQTNSVRKPSPSRNTSRRLVYDTASSDADTIVTDHSNDTLADLNVTFPSDNSDSYKSNVRCTRQIYATRACSPLSPQRSAKEGANKSLEDRAAVNSVGSRAFTKHSILYRQPNAKELVAATKIVACAKGFLVRRLMRTERVQATVQTIRDALLCALQLHQDREGIRGADVDLHRRLIQQITAACYTLHDTFVSSSAAERCSMIAADRARRQALATKPPSSRSSMRGDVMSQSHSGAFPSRAKRASPSLMSQSNYETFERPRSRFVPAQRKMPWR